METYRLKIKIGDHEFEAEGPVDVVQAQFAAFRDLIAAIPSKAQQPVSVERPSDSVASLPHLPLEKIMKVEGRVVSLTAKCETVQEAVLLILLGQMEFRSNQEVTGAELMDGLKQSGYMLPRVDKVLDALSAEGSAITLGINRGRRYRLSNQGHSQALLIAREVLTTIPE
jgi:hypothetical protein